MKSHINKSKIVLHNKRPNNNIYIAKGNKHNKISCGLFPSRDCFENTIYHLIKGIY